MIHDHYLISVPEVFDDLRTETGLIGRNVHWYIDAERDRYARKIRKGIVIAKPTSFSEELYQPIDPGVPNHRMYMSHDAIQEMANAGRKQLPAYYPTCRERIDFISLADIARLVDVEVGEEVYFHPNVTETENLHSEGIYKALPDALISVGTRMQAGWVYVEPIMEETVADGLIKSIDAESKLLEGIVRHIRLRPDLHTGDHVCFQHDSNWEYEVGGVTYFAMREENIWMKVNDEITIITTAGTEHLPPQPPVSGNEGISSIGYYRFTDRWELISLLNRPHQ